MIRSAALLCGLSLLPSLTAQQSLNELERKFRAEVQELATKSPSREQRDQQLAKHIVDLKRFLDNLARGDDRWNGRLMLADLSLANGDRSGASEALRTIDAASAPGLVLVTAAAMAQHLGMQEQRDAWVAAAIGKEAPLADRLAMARMLMTVLREIARGEQIFTAALAAAENDEQRSFVRWQRADALRDREDLPENSGFDELEKLAKDLPATYWGNVARDRLRATRLATGDEAIVFRSPTMQGKEFVLAEQQGKAVVLAFWSYSDFDTGSLIDTLRQLRRTHGDKLAVVGICLDRDVQAIQRATAELGIDFPVIGDGKGIETDAALRWFVEGPVVHVIDARGKVAGLGLQAGTADGRTHLQDAVARALAP